MKKRTKRIVVILLIILIPFIPIRTGIYKDGGTTDWRSLTYRVVVWNKFVTATDETMYDPVFIAVYRQAVYYGLGDPGYKKTVGALWTEETATERYRKWYDEQLKKAGYQPTSGQGAVPINSETIGQTDDSSKEESGRKVWTTDLFESIPTFDRGQYPTEEECLALFRNANEAGSWFVALSSCPMEVPGKRFSADVYGQTVSFFEVNRDLARSLVELREKLEPLFTDAQIDRMLNNETEVFANRFREQDGVLGVYGGLIGSNISLGETTLSELRIVDETHIETVWATEQLDVSTGKPMGEYKMHTFPLVWENGLWKFDDFTLIHYE